MNVSADHRPGRGCDFLHLWVGGGAGAGLGTGKCRGHKSPKDLEPPGSFTDASWKGLLQTGSVRAGRSRLCGREQQLMEQHGGSPQGLPHGSPG